MSTENTQEIAKVFGTEKERSAYMYQEVLRMFDIRTKTYEQFNDRKLINWVDDSRKRVNGYTPVGDKEEWQANVFNPVTRNKLKAIAASVASTVPRSKVVATDKKNKIDVKRAEIIESLLKYSRLKENTAMTHLFDVWNALTDGTVIKYDGYLKTKQKVRIVKKYNQITGETEVEEKDMIVDDKCIEVNVPIDQFYISDFYIYDIQKQPAVAWVRYLNEGELRAEFGKNKNFNKAKSNSRSAGATVTEAELSFYNNSWYERTEGKREYEVVQFYDKGNDVYRVVCNGVMLIDTPLLWGKANKQYPFAKGIFEPFAGHEFFYGNSIGSTLQFGQDVINTLYNMMIDKTYRSLVKPLLIGLANQDAFDLEDGEITLDTKIPVTDINQIKEMEISGIGSSDMAMLDKVESETNFASVDQTQSGIGNSGVTATEIRTANAKARELKGIFFTLLEDLWLQKNNLRVINIITNYTLPMVGEVTGEEEEYKSFAVPTELSNGENGILEVNVVGSKSEVPKQSDIDDKQKKSDMHIEYVYITSDYLDDYIFDVTIVTESLYATDKAENIADVKELLIILSTAFPEFFQANKEDFLKKRVLPAYGESMDNFTMPSPMQQLPQAEGQSGQPQGQGQNAALPAMNDALKLNQ